MRLIQVNASYKPAHIYGGPTMSVAKLCETLTAQEIDVEVLTTLANGQKELEYASGSPLIVDGVRVTYYKRITKDHSHFSPRLLLSLWKKLRENKNSIVHIHAWWNLVSVFSCLIAKSLNIPVVLSPRGMLTHYTQNNRNSNLKNLFHTLVGKSLLQYCHIHATSEKERTDILQIVTPKSIHVIPNLVELPTNIKPHINYTEDETCKLLFLSRIEEKKGLELLFKALSEVKHAWSLTIAGSGNEEYVANLKQLSDSLNLQSRINWIGQVSNSSKFDIISNHDLLVLTSFNENFANVIVESLYVGTPVLVSKNVGLAAYVEKYNLGWICDLESENIKAQISYAIEAKSERQNIRTNAPKLIKEDFKPNTLILQYKKLYEQISKACKKDL